MKPHPIIFQRLRPALDRQGFALVITLSLMILLALLAVGLLSLSAVAMRSSANGEAMARARANARMAMLIALGDLQKHTGPDRAVTASSNILSEKPPGKPNVTGVWESWDFKPDANNLDYEGEKKARFRRWLVSTPEPLAASERDFATRGFGQDGIVLAGPAAYGEAAPAEAPDPQGRNIIAGRVPVMSRGALDGAIAWHVDDESAKARINSYRDPGRNSSLAAKRALLAGHRPDPGQIRDDRGGGLGFLPRDGDVAEFREAEKTAGKLPTLSQADLLAEDRRMARFRSHVTPYSYGLPVNVREGGLKQDLSSLFNFSTTALPPAYNAKRLYDSVLGVTGPTDPQWSVLKGYHDVYKDRGMQRAIPEFYQRPAETVQLARPVAPSRFYAAPVIQKVEILFSVVVRDSHGPWSTTSTGLTQHTRMIHLLYAPIITLHNPYNANLKFDQLDIDIKGVPMAFNFYVNGEPQNNALVPFNEMFVVGTDRYRKGFFLSISNWSSTSSSSPSPITMRPGEVLVCGPYINGDAIFGVAGHDGASVFFDYQNNLTGYEDSSGNVVSRAKCKPGFLGRHVSYDVDWITPGHAPYGGAPSTDGGRGVLIVRPNDRFHIDWQVRANAQGYTDKFSVKATLTSLGQGREYGGLEFAYMANNTTFDKLLPTTYRYPDARSSPDTLLVEDLFHSNLSVLRTHTRAKSFALFSAYARTCNAGVYDHYTREKLARGQNLQHDGRLAGLPFLHHNPARGSTIVDLKADLPAFYSHEMNAQPLPGHVDDILNIDRTNRGYALIGHKTTRGIKSGAYLELPSGPLQTLADFRRSNALATPQLPTFVQPVANSHSSPLIPTTHVIYRAAQPRYALLDHSVLANHALYDRFYFSTISQVGNDAPDQVLEEFLTRKGPLPSQCFEPYLAPGETVDTAKAGLVASGRATAEAYLRAAEYQLIRTPFNVNSTSVQAWKGVLGALSPSMIQALWAVTGEQQEWKSEHAPILPMSLVIGGKVGGFRDGDIPRIDNRLTNDFNGYRELTPTQLDVLATRIVEEVRKRGPFLSLAEFVNRRIGPESQLTRVGALQAAIDESKINTDLIAAYVTPIEMKDIADARLYGYPNAQASTGHPAAGAPGWIMQGDLMRLLEPGATVRGDTFVIRACGEATDSRGKVLARAYLETVVQRLPSYLNPADRPSTNVWAAATADAAPENRKFGRQYHIVAFRWLSPSEI